MKHICNKTANPVMQIENYAKCKLCKIKLKIMQSENHAKCKKCTVQIMQSTK